jgi:chaperonin GroES
LGGRLGISAGSATAAGEHRGGGLGLALRAQLIRPQRDAGIESIGPISHPVGPTHQRGKSIAVAHHRVGVGQFGGDGGQIGVEHARESTNISSVASTPVPRIFEMSTATLIAVAGTAERLEKLPIKMLNDRLLVRIPDKDGERRSQGGILIPATAQIAKRLVWAEVVALGGNVRAAEVGDLVLFSPEDRYEVEVQGCDYIMLRERDLHALAAKRIEASTGLYL